MKFDIVQILSVGLPIVFGLLFAEKKMGNTNKFHANSLIQAVFNIFTGAKRG